eukprot:jgi/Botrbrau1/12790/Bobra.117_1s0009.1
MSFTYVQNLIRNSTRLTRGGYALAGHPRWQYGNPGPSHLLGGCQNSAFYSTSVDQPFETIVVETSDGVTTITLSRPKSLNALNSQAMAEILSAARTADADPSVKAIIITGSGNRAFAAGADIKEMASQKYAQAYGRLLEGWMGMRDIRKPLIAAVNGAALGGGCELAMMCDIIIAAENATLGQPELSLGVIPGMGGTQRLIRAVGKSKAMEMILTASRITAEEAKHLGLVSKVVAQENLMSEARQLAAKIAGLSAPAVAKAKDCINRAYEIGLSEGCAMSCGSSGHVLLWRTRRRACRLSSIRGRPPSGILKSLSL